ncbi:helix-turn-helix domain-containing protein [Streptomyces globosus]|uniref:helix-turn-helix domain-containing protein n=1 Tax=Streptomyces globosus TaxID=68209 RepID=UPI0038136783
MRRRPEHRTEPAIPNPPAPTTPARPSGTPTPAQIRSDDVLKLHRLAHSGGSAAVLRWLGARLGGWAGVVGAAAGPDPHGTADPRTPELALRGAAELADRGLRSAVLDDGGSTALLFALGEGRALAAVLPPPHDPAAPALLADAAVPLALVLRAEAAERREQRAELAESRAREAVLHLLMNGRLSTAHQIAEALSPSLPEPMRMYVVACRPGERTAVARLCGELTGGSAWVVRCPVYEGHLIVLVPAGGPDGPDGHAALGAALAAAVPGGAVGASGELPLREAPAAYTQAFHALAVARSRPERHARFGPGPEPELAAHAAGSGWAAAVLAPLHTYRPRRPQDPGAQELRATARAWLDFGPHATRLLKVHRNTLATRLRLIESLTGADLSRLPDQAALSLALRLTPDGPLAVPAGPGAPPAGLGAGLDTVLRHPDVAAWARAHLAPLTGPDAPPGAYGTVRAWLRHDGRLAPTAAALGISVPGTRKRLARTETVLQRSLLRSPSARHDLWLAHHAAELDGAAPPC